MKALSLTTLCVALTPCFSNAADLTPLGADSQDVIFFSVGGPVRLRFHLHQEGQTVTQQWTKFADQIFDYADRNGDGKLDKDEVRFLSMIPFGSSSSGSYGVIDFDGTIAISGSSGVSQGTSFDISTLDTDKNGFVSREEFTRALSRSGYGPVRVVVSPPSGSTEQLTAALFNHLDENKDGKLSKEELDAGFDVLMKLDQDEDEIITSQELLQMGQRNTNVLGVVPAFRLGRSGTMASAPQQQRPDFFTLRAEATSMERVKELLVLLDKDKNGKLSASELRMSAEAFAKLDKNGDGQLEPSEIEAWLTGNPEIDLTIPLGGTTNSMNQMMNGKPRKERSLEVKAAKGSVFEKSINKGADGIPRLMLADAILSLTSDRQNRDGIFLVSFLNLNGNFDDIFKKATGPNKGLDKKKLRESPELQYLLGSFDLADRNGDGILELAELKKFQSVQSSGNDVQVEIHITDEGRGLFDLIDTNHDGRLSMREIRNAWKQLASLSKDGKSISRDNLPKQIPMFVRRANLTATTGQYGFAVSTAFMSGTRAVVSNPQGPVWFQKMDRNGDGDVSRKEFLGPPELFDKLDKDGDGLISLEEAMNAEKEPKN